MSSIAASDRSNQTDEIRRIREEYENKESENAKKKNKEVRQMGERQDKEISKLKSEYDSQIESLRGKQTEAITDRERQHVEDVNKIRDMYVESLKRKTLDDARSRESAKSTFDLDLGKQKDIAEQQRTMMQKNTVTALNEKDRVMTENQQRNEQLVKESISGSAQKLTKKHEEELQAVAADRDRVIGETTKLISDIKSNDKNVLDAEKRSHRLEVERGHTNFQNATRDQQEMSEAMLESKNEILKEELGHLGQVYRKKLADETDKMGVLRDQYSEQYDGRTGTELKKIQSDLSKAKNQQVIDAIGAKKANSLEKKHIIGEYQEREDDLQKEKAGIFESVNEVAHDRIAQTTRNSEKLIADTNRRNKIDQQVSDMRYRDAFAQNEASLKDQVGQTKNKAEERVQKVMRVSTLAQKNQLRLHEDGLNALKEKHSENLQDQREAQLESLKSLYERMDQRLKSAEQRLGKKHEDAVDFYENKIDSLTAQQKEETQRLTKNYEARANQREKAVKQEEGMIATKYEQKMSAMEDVNRKEVERLERRHQEQMQAVISRVNAAQKKV